MKTIMRRILLPFLAGLLLGCGPGEVASVVVNRNAVPVMKKPVDFRAGGEMVTEVLLGEPVRILDKNGQWLHVSLPWQKDKQPGANEFGEYRGWIRADSGSIVTNQWREYPGGDWYVLVGTTDGHGFATVFLDEQCRRAVTRSIGIVLPAARRQPAAPSLLALRTPDGSLMYASRNAVVAWGSLQENDFREAVAVHASKLVGKPYVWGGNSGPGVDCSGLVYLAARCAGRLVPRDTFPQYEVFAKIGRQDLAVGDLVYYQTYAAGASHVSMMVPGQGRIIHASGSVKYDSLDNPQLKSVEIGYRRMSR